MVGWDRAFGLVYWRDEGMASMVGWQKLGDHGRRWNQISGPIGASIGAIEQSQWNII